MMRLSFAIASLALVVSVVSPMDANATSLKIQPLQYKTTLKKSEIKQGFIDVSNPSTRPTDVKVSVRAFKQINDDGGVQFYDDEQIEKGIVPELRTIRLEGRGAVRMYFSVYGNRLPQGDVFAALFFTSEPSSPVNGIGQTVRVGTLLSIINQTPGGRSAAITGLSIPFLQLSNRIEGTYSIKNIGTKESGFYPTVNVSSWPGERSKQVEGSLVFGGRERSNDFSYDLGYGISRVTVGYNDSSRSQLVVTLPPWALIVGALILIVITIEIVLLKRRRAGAPKPPKATATS